MATVLIVEDDESLRTVIADKLSRRYAVMTASGGAEALRKLEKQKADIMVADVMMPGMDGFALTQKIRERDASMPILLATAKSEFSDKKAGFTAGADDYMVKPIDLDELEVRVAALLRRAKISSENQIAIGNFYLNAATFSVSYGGRAIELTRKEFDLLFKLLSYPNKLFSKSKLMDEIWGYDCPSDDSTIRTHISRLRGKLADVTEFDIVAVKGIGYKAVIRQ